MIYGYARCSTNEELQDINRQIRELIQLGAGEENIYREYESGMKNDRVELQRLLSAVEAGDTILDYFRFVCKIEHECVILLRVTAIQP